MAMPQDFALARAAEQLGEVSVEYDDEQTLIRLRGEVDLALAGCLGLAQDQVIQRGLSVRIDVSAVTFMDSTGLGLIIRVVAAERRHGRRVTVEGVSGQVKDLLRVSGVDQAITQIPERVRPHAPLVRNAE